MKLSGWWNLLLYDCPEIKEIMRGKSRFQVYETPNENNTNISEKNQFIKGTHESSSNQCEIGFWLNEKFWRNNGIL